MIAVQKATIADIPELVRLNKFVQSLHAEAYPALFRRNTLEEVVASAFTSMIEAPGAFWLIAVADRPCGYLCADFRERPESWFRPPHRICNVSHVSVDSDYRKKGVARRLVDRLLQEAASRGLSRIELDVWTFNTEAIECFERLGFRTFNRRMEYIPTEATSRDET